VTLNDVVWKIKLDEGSNGDFTLNQAWDRIEQNPQNNTAYYLYLSQGNHIVTRHFGLIFTSKMNISIHYIANASERSVLRIPEERYPLWMNHSGIKRVSFTGLSIENSSISVASCDQFEMEAVTFVGKFHSLYDTQSAFLTLV
jgi:hypothetical protein